MRPIGSPLGLEEPGGLAGLDQEEAGHLAVGQGVEQLPGGQLAIGADLEVAGADSAQVHAGVGVDVRSIDPRRGRFQQGPLPTLQIFSREAEGRRGGSGQRGRRTHADQFQELAPGHVAVLRATAARAIAFPRHGLVLPFIHNVYRCFSFCPLMIISARVARAFL